MTKEILTLATTPQRARRRRPPRRRAAVQPVSSNGQPGGVKVPKPNYQALVKELRRKDVLTPGEIGILMVAGGFPKKVDVISGGISVAMCESTGNRRATSRNPSGGTNRSIWQIDDRSHDISVACSLDNLCATQKAKAIWSASEWSLWACSPNSGNYELVAKAILDDFGGIGGTGIPNPLSPISDTVEAAKAALRFLARLFEPAFWLRVGKTVLGALALIIGILLLGRAILGTPDYVSKGRRAARGKVAAKRSERRERRAGERRTAEVAERAKVAQAAREEAKTVGSEARRKRFFETVNKDEPPF